MNELFVGERIQEAEYKLVADNNLLEALENSSFTLKEKVQFYKRKWKKENIYKFIFAFVIWLGLILGLKFYKVDGYFLGAISGILCILFYILFYNQMMIYVEKNAFKK